MKHHTFIYDLYHNNTSFPVDGYVEEFFIRFRVTVSKSTIERWFMTIGSFKGSMRITSRYPSGMNSWTTYNMLKSYLSFILSIDNHSRIVFTDEMPIQEIYVY